MQHFIVSIVLGLCLYSPQLLAAFDGAPLDTLKFAFEAQHEMALSSIDTNGEIFFQDGALSTDHEPLFDAGSLFYISNQSFSIFAQKFSVAYRLRLIDGSTDLTLVEVKDLSRRVLDPKSIGFVLPDGYSNQTMSDAAALLQARFPSAKIEVYESFGIIYLRWLDTDLRRIVDAVAFIQAELKPIDISFDEEVYRFPFVFGRLQAVPISTVVDLDTKRDLLHGYIQRGLQFTTTQSTIPDRLK